MSPPDQRTVTDRIDEYHRSRPSRRGFLGLAAAVGGVGLAGCSTDEADGGGSNPTAAPTTAEGPMTEEPTTEAPMEMVDPDVSILNYALTLEHLENAFYRDGLAEFADDELVGATVLDPYGDEIRSAVPGRLAAIGAHEAAHVEAIAATVTDLGGEPVAEAEYDFGYETPSEFLGVARALENTGVSAYAGAAPSVSNDGVFAAALGIHSVEARHASFLNELNVASPFPDGMDGPRTMDEVVEIAGQFIVG